MDRPASVGFVSNFIASAMTARGTMVDEEIVYAAHIEFGLSNRYGVGVVRGDVSIPICGLEEQTEPMELRTHGSMHAWECVPN
jgi:hypothetical protein